MQRLILKLFCLMIVACPPAMAAAQEQTQTTAQTQGPSGLAIPRFVSLKADRVNVRKGPSTEHPVTLIYRRMGLPVEIIAESERWRRVRDADGIDGWIFHTLLSGRRTALIMPWAKANKTGPQGKPTSVALYTKRSARGNVVANMEPGVIVDLDDCDGEWCVVSIDGYRGWVEQEKLWGVYKGEKLE